MSETGVHNGVIALADALPVYTLKQLLDEIYAKDEFPFFVLADEIQYEQIWEQYFDRLCRGNWSSRCDCS